MSDVAPLSPRAKELTDRVTKRFLEQLSNGIDNSVSYDQISGASGLIARTGPKAFSGRAITGVVNQTSVTNGNGLSGNPTIGISSTYLGQTSISTLGTITTGDVSDASVIAGITSRHLDTKLSEVISVKDYGATGDGSTDDTAAINATIIAVTSLYPHGGRVYIPEGTYLISSSINTPATSGKGVQIFGAGSSKTTLIRKQTYTNGDIFFIDDVANEPSSWVEIKDLTIINGNGALVTGGYALHVKNRAYVSLENIYIYDGYGAVHIDTSYVIAYNVSFEFSDTYATTYGAGLAGFHMSGIGCAAKLVNCSAFGAAVTSANDLITGLLIEASDGLQASNCSFSGITGVGFSAVGNNIDNCYFSNCIIDSCRQNGVVLAGVNAPAVYTNIRFSDCHINARIDSGLATNNVVIEGDCDYVSFIGCNMNAAGAESVIVTDSNSYLGIDRQSIQFIGCEISYNDLTHTGTSPGINLRPDVSGVQIVGCTIQNRQGVVDTQSYGIALQGSNLNCTIVGNKLSPNISGGIYYGGSGYTNLRVYGNIGANDRMGTIDAGLWNGTTISEIYGGTNQTTYTQGDMLYSSASNTLSKLAKNTNSTRYLSNQGSSNSPSWNQVNLANGITGVTPVANGGTNASSASITAFNNITGYTAAGATGTTSTNLVFSTSPSLTTPSLGVATATTINGCTLTSGTLNGTVTGTNTGDQTTVSGNAGTATVLATARNINGVSFNGSANIETTYANLSKFSAVGSTQSGATGDGTAVTLICGTEVFDTGNEHNTTTGVFTAAATGYYSFSGTVDLRSVSVAHTGIIVTLVTTSRTYYIFYKSNSVNTADILMFSWAVNIADMLATQTASVSITVSGGTKTVSLGDQSRFMGNRVL